MNTTITEEMKNEFNDDFFLALKKHFPAAEGSLGRETGTGHIVLYSHDSEEAEEITTVLAALGIKSSSKIFWGLDPEEDKNQYCWEVFDIKTGMVIMFGIFGTNCISEIDGYLIGNNTFKELNSERVRKEGEYFEYFVDAKEALENQNDSDYYTFTSK